MIPKINPLLFDWVMWRNGSPIDLFGMPLRDYSLYTIAPLIKKYAIGYCEAESLQCRPKLNHKAVMFDVGCEYYWFHLTDREFSAIFEI
jgi:hypothetical protein